MKKLWKRLKKELRVYFRSWELLMRGSMEYRGWPLKLLQTFLFVITDPLDLILLFSRFGSIGEWSVEQIVLVYAMSVCCFGLAECFGRGFDMFPNLVRSGGLDRILLRPCSIFSQVASSSFQFHRLVRPTTCAAAIVWCLVRMKVHMGFREILLLVSAMLGGMILYTAIFIFISGLSVYTIQGLEWVYILTNGSYQITRVPPVYLPDTVRRVFTWVLPVFFVSFYPASAICHWGVGEALGYWTLPVSLIFLSAALCVWRRGIRHYQGTGT